MDMENRSWVRSCGSSVRMPTAGWGSLVWRAGNFLTWCAPVFAAGNVTENDPPGTQGYETYRFGVRRLREMLRPDGWVSDNTEGLATIASHQLRMRIAIANTDDATGVADRLPQNRREKGPTAGRAAAINGALLPGIEWPYAVQTTPSGIPVTQYATWYFCIYIDRDDVRAELSLLNGFQFGFFTEWQERIILLQPGGWKTVDLPAFDDDPGPEFDVDVRPR
jgi:hypothetical protein